MVNAECKTSGVKKNSGDTCSLKTVQSGRNVHRVFKLYENTFKNVFSYPEFLSLKKIRTIQLSEVYGVLSFLVVANYG